MGISAGIKLNGGVELKDSYININNYLILKKNNYACVKLDFFKDKESRDNGLETVKPSSNFEIPEDFYTKELRPILNELESKLYEYIKGLDQFKEFNDILE